MFPDFDAPPPAEYPDAAAHPMLRGRAAGINPGNRFEGLRLHILGEHLDEAVAERPDGVQVRTEVIPDHTRSIINRVDSPDLGFEWTINPYRGCEHGCIYCYARPTHETLGFSCGVDFETRIVVKFDAPDLLRRELASPKWRGEPIVMSGVTDPYQPIEAKLRITRGCLEIMAECRQPVSIVTKNRLVTRDLDLLSELARHDAVRVAVSLTTLDPALARKMEPRASAPAERLAAMRELSSAGVPVVVMTAPIIPCINDSELPLLLEAAAQAGAVGAGWVMLRLPYQVKALFFDWLARHFPDRADHVVSRLRDIRGGVLYNAAFGARMRGGGPVAEIIGRTFDVHVKRCGLDRRLPPLNRDAFRRPTIDGQMGLF